MSMKMLNETGESRYEAMRKGYTIFKAVSFTARIFLILLYFGAAAQVMAEIWGDRFLAVTLLYVAVLEIFQALMEAGNIRQRRILDLVYGQFFAALCTNVLFGLLLWTISAQDAGSLFWEFLLLTLLESFTGILWAAFSFTLYLRKQTWKQALYVYGDRENWARTVKENNSRNGYFHISKAVSYKEGISFIEKILPKYQALFLGVLPDKERNLLLKAGISKDRECYLVPGIADIYLQNSRVIRLHDKVLFSSGRGFLTREQERVKRAEDILFALLLLIPSLPLMALISLCIKAEDGGPVFYRQERVTQYGRSFSMLKFRSMVQEAEKDGPQLAAKHDARITRTGKILRNLHLDELPQLFNVLAGQMSMVGPRPERREFIEDYSRIIPEFRERLRVKGGLTGYAQIYGKYSTGPEDKLKYDLIYIYNYSLRLDIRLLFLTVRIFFQKENAQGVEEDTQRQEEQENKIKE